MEDLTWTCHVCGERRPDDKISVFSRDDSGKYNLPKGTVTTNVRYCNDRSDCREGTKTFDFSSDKEAKGIL